MRLLILALFLTTSLYAQKTESKTPTAVTFPPIPNYTNDSIKAYVTNYLPIISDFCTFKQKNKNASSAKIEATQKKTLKKIKQLENKYHMTDLYNQAGPQDKMNFDTYIAFLNQYLNAKPCQ